MTMTRSALAVGMATVVVLVGSTRWTLRAQDGRPATGKVRTAAPAEVTIKTEKVAPPPAGHADGSASIQDALLRPFSWPFREDTTLQLVADYLKKNLRGPVVLDRAALARKKLTPETTVRLELEGVRLKTGLKLLLDQAGLTYRIVSEDNLLILTDTEGAEETSDRVLAELKALHHDVSDLRVAVDNLREDLAPESDAGPSLRKPTIIEEVPEGDGKGMPAEKPARSRPGM